MIDANDLHGEGLMKYIVPDTKALGITANDLCENALSDAKSQLHPLLQNIELNHLDRRAEFLQAFKSAMEQRIARKLAIWQPAIQAVFKYDEMPMPNVENWDGSIHLLVKVPRLSDTVKMLGETLGGSLTKRLKQWGWSRCQKRQSILDVQQVTPNEIRRGIGYGAMFCAVYTAPVKVWPPKGRAS